MYFNEDFRKYGQTMAIMKHKRKKILLFHSFWVTCKISFVPGAGGVGSADNGTWTRTATGIKKSKSFNLLWCPEQDCFNYFLLSINSCYFGLYELSYTQITHQNPVKRKKYGQTMAKGFHIIWMNNPLSVSDQPLSAHTSVDWTVHFFGLRSQYCDLEPSFLYLNCRKLCDACSCPNHYLTLLYRSLSMPYRY